MLNHTNTITKEIYCKHGSFCENYECKYKHPSTRPLKFNYMKKPFHPHTYFNGKNIPDHSELVCCPKYITGAVIGKNAKNLHKFKDTLKNIPCYIRSCNVKFAWNELPEPKGSFTNKNDKITTFYIATNTNKNLQFIITKFKKYIQHIIDKENEWLRKNIK